MRTLIVTALFDINRSESGDGRSIDEYLNWFKKTLSLKCDMLIYTESKFHDFVINNRVSGYKTKVVIQKLEDIPFYEKNEIIKEIIKSNYYLSKMKDTSRIECYLSEYNVIQYSKFGWLKMASDMDYDNYFWMDAGCSRFFDSFDINKEWPNQTNVNNEKITIQGNSNFVNGFDKMNIQEYIWDNNCMLVGTLFGGGREIINILYEVIYEIFDFLVDNKCINNEQFALALVAKKQPELFDIKIKLGDGHLPLFKILGN
jgi:hypothetical protein